MTNEDIRKRYHGAILGSFTVRVRQAEAPACGSMVYRFVADFDHADRPVRNVTVVVENPLSLPRIKVLERLRDLLADGSVTDNSVLTLA